MVHEHNRRVLASLETLGTDVRSSLERLEVAEALDKIVLQLKQVCSSFQTKFPFTPDI
jgi:methionyl-tRNA synthetase